MKYVDRALARRGGNHAVFEVKDIGIDPVADRKALSDHFPSIRIHRNKHLGIAPSDEEPPVLAVHCDGGGLSCRRDLPSRFDHEFVGINSQDLVRVFEVVVDHPLAIGYGLLRSATQRKCGHDCSLSWIDHGRIFATPIEDKQTLGCRIIKNGIGITARLDLTKGFESLQIEDHDLTRFTVCDESTTEIVDDNDTVAALQIGNGANNRAFIGVDHFDLTAVREINAASRVIECDVVKILLPARSGTEWDLLKKVIARGRARKNVGTEEQQVQTKKNMRSFHASLQCCFYQITFRANCPSLGFVTSGFAKYPPPLGAVQVGVRMLPHPVSANIWAL